MSPFLNLATSLALLGIGVLAGFLFSFRFAFEQASLAFEAIMMTAVQNGDATEDQIRTILTSWRKNQT